MVDFRSAFETYGADYDTTMKRFLGNREMYLKILGLLPRDDSMEKLGKALDAGDLERAFEAAHTLKGVAGNLGLTPLYEAACAMVEPLRHREQREEYAALYQVVEAEYERALQLLEEMRGGESPS